MYERHRFPPEIIQYVVWLYHRFNLSHRDIEDLTAERGISISYEPIRLWCLRFGAIYAKRLRRRHQGYGDTFYLDEIFVRIHGKQYYLWRAVDQDGESELRCCSSENHAGYDPRHLPVRQQSSGTIASANASSRTRHEASQGC